MRMVLIIDDEDDIRFGMRLALEEQGYTVIEASNGRKGLTRIRQATAPLIVLLDLMMPHMSGLALLRELGNHPAFAAHHAFVLVTGARAFTAETLARYLPNRRLYALPKPFEIDQLVQVVEQAEWDIACLPIAGGTPDGRAVQASKPAS